MRVLHFMLDSDKGKKAITSGLFPFCEYKNKTWYSNDNDYRDMYDILHCFILTDNEYNYLAMAVGMEVEKGIGELGFWCSWLEVRKEYRGNEYGIKLLNELQKWFNASFIALGASNNKRIYKYYIPRGFKKIQGRILEKKYA